MASTAAMARRERARPHHWSRHVAAGVVGGLIASWVMTRFHVALYGGGVTGVEEPQSHRPVDGGRNDATTKAADAAVTAVTSAPLTHAEKQVAGPVVHYLFGASMGAIYGALSHARPELTAGAGMPFGVAVWLLADEVALPLVGLAERPQAYPFSTHAEMLAAHLLFGLTTHVAADQYLRLITRGSLPDRDVGSDVSWY